MIGALEQTRCIEEIRKNSNSVIIIKRIGRYIVITIKLETFGGHASQQC